MNRWGSTVRGWMMGTNKVQVEFFVMSKCGATRVSLMAGRLLMMIYSCGWNGVDRSWEKNYEKEKQTKNKAHQGPDAKACEDSFLPAVASILRLPPTSPDFDAATPRSVQVLQDLRSLVDLKFTYIGSAEAVRSAGKPFIMELEFLSMVFWPLEDSIYLTCSRYSSELHKMNILGGWFPEMACQKQIDKNRN